MMLNLKKEILIYLFFHDCVSTCLYDCVYLSISKCLHVHILWDFCMMLNLKKEILIFCFSMTVCLPVYLKVSTCPYIVGLLYDVKF